MGVEVRWWAVQSGSAAGASALFGSPKGNAFSAVGIAGSVHPNQGRHTQPLGYLNLGRTDPVAPQISISTLFRFRRLNFTK